MKYLSLILLIFATMVIIGTMSGCSTPSYVRLTEQNAENGLQRYHDTKQKVICYVYRDGKSNALSCLKDEK